MSIDVMKQVLAVMDTVEPSVEASAPRYYAAREALRAAIEPRQWQGLTEAEKVNVALECGCADVAWMDFADAIESKLRDKNT